MTVTKEKVKEKARHARDMLKHHPLTPELALKLFISIGVGVFRFSTALVQWTWRELMELQTILQVRMETAALHSLGCFHFSSKSRRIWIPGADYDTNAGIRHVPHKVSSP